MDKEQKWRMEGMQFALKVVREGGVEALEKECAMRGVNDIPIPIKQATLDDFSQRIKARMLDTLTVLVSITLHDEFKFGKQRIEQFITRFNEKADCIGNDYCTWQDNIDALEEECNIKLKIKNQNYEEVKI